MIYAPGRFLFLHNPRTGGIAITNALSALIPYADVVIDTGIRRHWNATELALFFGSELLTVPRFCVVRDYTATIESTYRLILRDARDRPPKMHTNWLAIVDRIPTMEKSAALRDISENINPYEVEQKRCDGCKQFAFPLSRVAWRSLLNEFVPEFADKVGELEVLNSSRKRVGLCPSTIDAPST